MNFNRIISVVKGGSHRLGQYWRIPGVVKGTFAISALEVDVDTLDVDDAPEIRGKITSSFDKELQAFGHNWNLLTRLRCARD